MFIPLRYITINNLICLSNRFLQELLENVKKNLDARLHLTENAETEQAEKTSKHRDGIKMLKQRCVEVILGSAFFFPL